VKAVNNLLTNKQSLLENCTQVKSIYTDCTEIDAEMSELKQEIDVVTELARICIQENTQTAQNQVEFQKRYSGLDERFESATQKYDELDRNRTLRLARADSFDAFIRQIESVDGAVSDFDERLWQMLVDRVTVRSDGVLVFRFNNSTEIEN